MSSLEGALNLRTFRLHNGSCSIYKRSVYTHGQPCVQTNVCQHKASRVHSIHHLAIHTAGRQLSKKVSADTASRGSKGAVRHAVAVCPAQAEGLRTHGDRMSNRSFGRTAAVSTLTFLHRRESQYSEASRIGQGQQQGLRPQGVYRFN